MPSRTNAGPAIGYVDFAAQYAEEKDEMLAAATRVFARGDFIGGAAVADLEADLARLIGVEHVIGLSSGTAALELGMSALGIGPGDEVITPPNSFVASTTAIVRIGATPVFADVGADQNIDPAAIAGKITSRTRAIMPVHLTGRVADMEPILALARRHNLVVVEDAAQAIGSRYQGRMAGSFGAIGCFSAHPLKILNATGDAGFVATRDRAIAERLRILRNIGLENRDTLVAWGTVARLDTLQAEILKGRLKRLDAQIARRRAIVDLYRVRIKPRGVFIPPCRNVEFNTFQTFVIQADRRDALKTYLAARNIGTAIHYPIPIHLQPVATALGFKAGDFPEAERQAGRILSLPAHPYLSDADVATVAAAVNTFYGA